MSQVSEPKPILTMADLIERWGVSRTTILMHVDNPDNPLPTLPLGDPSNRNRSLLRFRLDAVEAWEASKERYATRPPEQEQKPTGKPAWFTGEVHTGGKKKTTKQ